MNIYERINIVNDYLHTIIEGAIKTSRDKEENKDI